jgi:inward rectifier potassium channel
VRRRPSERGTRVTASNLGLEFAKIGARRFDLSDPYHLALTARWWIFVLGVFGLYGLITSLFGLLYLVQPGCVANVRPGSLDPFFFSIETLATVGYGVMSPVTLYGHVVASTEIVTGMAFTAIMTGLIFVRFSKPRARFVFADVAVIARHNGRPTLMVRVGNGRTTVLTNVAVEMNALLNQLTPEGGRYRNVHDLRLTRARFPIFPLITTFMHVIDESSPLFGFDAGRVADTDVRLIVSIEARDPMLAATVHDLKSYGPEDVRPGMRFVDAVIIHDDGLVVADLTLISHLEVDPAASAAAS